MSVQKVAARLPGEQVIFTERPHDKTRLDIIAAGESRAHVEIERMTLRYGASTLPAAYIGDVFTEEPWRNRGYARRLVTAALDRSRADGAAFSVLYGIGDFYPKFGYTTIGADFGITLRGPERGAHLPDGWQVRAAATHDVPAIQRLYDADTADGIMRRVRRPDDHVWERLRALIAGRRPEDECRVLVSPLGNVRAYAWLGRGFWMIDHAQERYWPNDLSIGEVIAADHAAADAALAACRLWAVEEQNKRGTRVATVHVGTAPGNAVTAAAQHQEAAAHRTSWLSAGPQVRTIDARRLLTSIAPELSRRAAALRVPWTGTAIIATDAGSAALIVDAHGAELTEAPGVPGLRIEIAQTTLIRLVLGAFPPHDLLARSEPHLTDDARACLATLFPQRQPYMYQLDRG